MERLTNEEIKNCYDYHSQGRKCGKTLLYRTCNELLEYKAREKELGIDLITLSKCKYVYVRKANKIKMVPVLINLRRKRILIHIFWNFVKPIKFSKYGIDFALTKEELEK